MQVGIFNCLGLFILNDYAIVASIIIIVIRNLINCAALVYTEMQPQSFQMKTVSVTFSKVSVFDPENAGVV